MSNPISPGYYQMANGAQVIDITETLNFCRGNAVKYIVRAGKKNPRTELEDLRKAQWYLEREIARLSASTPTAPAAEPERRLPRQLTASEREALAR